MKSFQNNYHKARSENARKFFEFSQRSLKYFPQTSTREHFLDNNKKKTLFNKKSIKKNPSQSIQEKIIYTLHYII